jgi:hypothetical protein
MADRARRRSVAGYSLGERLHEDELRTTYRASIEGRDEHFHIFRGLGDPEEQEARHRELRYALSIPAHPRVLRVITVGREGNTVYAATEAVLAPSLKAWTERQRPTGLPIEASLWVARSVLLALAHLHALPDALPGPHEPPAPDGMPRPFVLRRVTPSALFASPDGAIKLDIIPGLCRFRSHKELHGQSMAPLGFESPEQILGEPLDPRSDLFSVGATLASLLLGREVLVGPNTFETYQRIIHANAQAPKLLSALRPKLQTMLGRALRQEREARFQSADEFAAAVAHVAAVLGVEVSPAALAGVLATS